MVINYCFTVYNEPELLRHTILRLQHPNARFFIHVDNRVDIQNFIDITKGIDNITFIKNRIASQWGDISTVDAILSLLRAALADGKDGYCIILSGQDYPLKTPEQIFQYLNSSYPKEFIHASTESQWRPWLKKIMMSHAKGYWITLGGKIKLVVYPRKHLKISGIPSLRFKQIPEIMRKLLSIDTLTTIKNAISSGGRCHPGLKCMPQKPGFK